MSQAEAEINASSLAPEPRPDISKYYIVPKVGDPGGEDLHKEYYRAALEEAQAIEAQVIQNPLDAMETARRVKDPLSRMTFMMGYGYIETQESSRDMFFASLLQNISNYYYYENVDSERTEVLTDQIERIAELMNAQNAQESNWNEAFADLLVMHWAFYSEIEYSKNPTGNDCHLFHHILEVEVKPDEYGNVYDKETEGYMERLAEAKNRAYLSMFNGWESYINSFKSVFKTDQNFAQYVKFMRDSNQIDFVRFTSTSKSQKSTTLKIQGGQMAVVFNETWMNPMQLKADRLSIVIEKKIDKDGTIYPCILTCFPSTASKK